MFVRSEEKEETVDHANNDWLCLKERKAVLQLGSGLTNSWPVWAWLKKKVQPSNQLEYKWASTQLESTWAQPHYLKEYMVLFHIYYTCKTKKLSLASFIMWKSKALVVFSRSFCLKLQKSKTIASFIIGDGEGEIQFSWIENFAPWMSLWLPYTLYALILSIISQLFFPCLQWGSCGNLQFWGLFFWKP